VRRWILRGIYLFVVVVVVGDDDGDDDGDDNYGALVLWWRSDFDCDCDCDGDGDCVLQVRNNGDVEDGWIGVNADTTPRDRKVKLVAKIFMMAFEVEVE